MNPFKFIILRSPVQSISQTFVESKKITSLFEEGVYLASTELWKELKKTKSLDDKEKLKRSFFKYWVRSCTRCTPFGTFAGSAVVNLSGNETSLIIGDSRNHARRTRLDMNYIALIHEEIEKIPQVQQQLYLVRNNSIYETYFDFRYAEYYIKNDQRVYNLTSVEKTHYLKEILNLAKVPQTINDLAVKLSDISDVTIDEASDFIKEMWDSQLLVSEFNIYVTGKEPLEKLIEQLERFEGIEELKNVLKEITYSLKHPKVGVEYLLELEAILINRFKIKDLPKNLIQTDLVLSTASNEINEDLVQTIVKQSKDLMFLARELRLNALDDFKKRYLNRYEQQEIPLVFALDADLGVGYAGAIEEATGGGKWINDLRVSFNPSERNIQYDHITEFVISKFEDYLINGLSQIEIFDTDVKSFKRYTENYIFPSSMYILGSLFKKNNSLNSNNFLFSMSSFSGPSAGNLLGRFTHSDDKLFECAKQIMDFEKTNDPDVIHAEIVHLPQSRVGNILLRKTLREYEIPYLGNSGLPNEFQIPIEDLMVSVSQNEVILRDRRNNKRIIPKLTTAHNFRSKSLPIYEFLCDLQFQGMSSPAIWDWGPLANLKFLPRVTYKDLILRKSRWKVSESDILDFENLEFNSHFQEFKNKWKIPDKVVISEHDNQLLIDFNNIESIELFISYIKKHKTIIIEEFLFEESNCIVKDVFGASYTNEIIIPVSLNYERKGSSINKSVNDTIQKKFGPGSEWLYFKIYSGPKANEMVLKDYILNFIEKSLNKNLFEKFYFIRYRDDSAHTRIRFYNDDPKKQALIQREFMKVLQPLIDNKLIHKIVIDTYIRELERYGIDLIEESETIFFNDSLAVLRFISLLEDNESQRYRLLFALRSIDMFLDDFNLSLTDKLKISEYMSESFFNEFGGGTQLRRQLNDKYRSAQQDIFLHMKPENDVLNEISEAVDVFKMRSKMNFQAINVIQSKLSFTNDNERYIKLLADYIHMFMNRLFISQQRKYELVVYHFLTKYYTSITAIKNKVVVSEEL
ncbi:lantibiotic dehydratase [Pedobacter cryoconitis]|uniref:Thiopeptide-type bacteriocin biosynthesis protein n=1 Tax=Pedobacter cryoconitis TaxID=188932 RepID=A0A7X0MLF3_9SPHI|nr:lantibiotic dehydratase [Pedobacter cryoconitis]MBB6503026.1 thiopeptide-type bacteriocin biosynthesis protein [Pedobacter cryoconitis]